MSGLNSGRRTLRRGRGQRAGVEVFAIIKDALRFSGGAWLLYNQTQQKEIQWLLVLVALGLMGWLSADKVLSLLAPNDSTPQDTYSLPEASPERGSQSSRSSANGNVEGNEREPA